MDGEWNVVVSVREDCYRHARRLLKRFGAVDRTDYYNVLAMRVDDIHAFAERLREEMEHDPELRNCLARAIPAARTFQFQSTEQFESRARAAVLEIAAPLKGKGFYVRMHRRGFRDRMSSQAEEQLLDRTVMESLDAESRVTFSDPDAVVAVETIGNWAGISLWTREELARYPFVRLG